MSRRIPAATAAFLAAVASLLPADRASAQDGFLFRTPTVTVGFRAGYSQALAGSDVFDLAMDELFLERSDFGGLTVGGHVSIRTTDRLDLGLDVGYSSSATVTEFRDFVGVDDLPIVQEVFLSRLPVTVNARWFLKDRGRKVSDFAWVPYRWAPYVGVGGGWIRHEYSQEGEFIDYDTNDILNGSLESEDWSGAAQAFAGVEYRLRPNVLGTAEARYLYADAPLDPTVFTPSEGIPFEDIDLSGFELTLGLSVRF